MIELDRRTQRRLQNDLDRYSLIEQNYQALVEDTRTGKALKALTMELNELAGDIKRYDIPVGTRMSSYDGAVTLGRFAGKRTLDISRYSGSGVARIMIRDHSECLVPVSPEIFAKAIGCDVDGYYRRSPYTVVTDGDRFRDMMDIIYGARA